MSTFRDTNVSTADETAQADALRVAMLAELRELGAVCAVVTKRSEHGAAISSLSESHIQATMLEQTHLEPGMRVLEIGTGGHNAAKPPSGPSATRLTES